MTNLAVRLIIAALLLAVFAVCGTVLLTRDTPITDSGPSTTCPQGNYLCQIDPAAYSSRTTPTPRTTVPPPPPPTHKTYTVCKPNGRVGDTQIVKCYESDHPFG